MSITRINIVAEGQSEREFAQQSLSEHLLPFGVVVQSRCVMTSKTWYKTYRGGLLDYGRAKRDIERWIAEEKSGDPYFTTMFDLYALPTDFPGYEAAHRLRNPYEKVALLEQAMREDIGYHKFIPYIQLHEFEALLLGNPDLLLDEYPEASQQIAALKQAVAAHQGNPELVNDGRETAPSKRIIQLIPEYEGNKVTVGAVLAAMEGIENQKRHCRHFGEWISRLEQLGA